MTVKPLNIFQAMDGNQCTDRAAMGHPADPDLSMDIPGTVSIHRGIAAIPRIPGVSKLGNRWLLMVDEQIGWYPFAVNRDKITAESWRMPSG
jgi:hypothetical protein